METKRYSHVIVVGIDGAGGFFEQADTPHFDRIFANGAKTFHALASNPTISAECWGSMLIGVGPEIHKLTNEIVSNQPYPTDSPFPTVFRRIRAVYPNAVLGSFCDWDPISRGIAEEGLGITKDTAPDTELTPKICDYVRRQKPDFLFIQFDSVDGAGHRNGYGSPAYLQRIHEVDALLGDVYSAAQERRAGRGDSGRDPVYDNSRPRRHAPRDGRRRSRRLDGCGEIRHVRGRGQERLQRRDRGHEHPRPYGDHSVRLWDRPPRDRRSRMDRADPRRGLCG